jgi:hypothetical protein
MRRIASLGVVRIAAALGLNAVPAVGVFTGGWSAPTAMLLYFAENVIAIPLVALRVRLLAPERDDRQGVPPRQRGELIRSFLLVAGGFSFAGGIFMAFFMGLAEQPIDVASTRTGILAIAAVQLAAYLFDLVLLGRMTLPAGEKALEQALGRVFLLHLAVILGILTVAFASATWFFLPFAVLKTIVDVGTQVQFLSSRRAAPASWWAVSTGGLRRTGPR